MPAISFYSQFPPRDFRVRAYEEHIPFLKRVEDMFDGSLVYFDHSTLDPWITAASIIQNTTRHIPLVAVQPYTMQPATVASMIYTFSHIYKRKVDINFVTGALPKDLEEVGDGLTKSERYERLREFGEIVKRLLSSNDPFSYDGKYYTYTDFTSRLALPQQYRPDFFVPMLSGSTDSVTCIKAIADTVVTLPNHLAALTSLFGGLSDSPLDYCVKIQLLARGNEETALATLRQDPGYYKRRLAKAKYLKDYAMDEEEKRVFFPTIDFIGPMIVGSYEQVVSYIMRYVDAGITKFIIPNVLSDEDLHHFQEVMYRLDQTFLLSKET